MADKDRLIQILFNLLDNAVQHTPEEGTIDITLTSIETHDPILRSNLELPMPSSGHRPTLDSLNHYGFWALLKIRDSGPGISPQDLGQIFDRFFRAERSRVRSFGGAGLGLSIAQALSKAHHAYLWIHSPATIDMKSGTLAMLLFPLANTQN
jgi:signal transduction histidine kinase